MTQTIDQTPPAAWQAPTSPPVPPADKTKPKRTWKTWQLVAAGVVGIILGTAAAGSSGGDTAKVKDLQAEMASVKTKAAEDVAAADKQAGDAVNVARAQVEKDAADRAAALDKRSADLDARSASLDQRDAAVSAKEAAKKASTFEDGTYQVGVDIQPGTYHTDGVGDLCFAQTNGANGAILDQEVQYGSVVFTIPATAKTFKSSSCGTWTKR